MGSPRKIAIIYNAPTSSHYDAAGETAAMTAVLEEVEAVKTVLERAGHQVTTVPLLPPREQAAEVIQKIKAEVVFNLFEGFGDDAEAEAFIASVLADTGLPLTGCQAHALALALDKGKSKELLLSVGVPTPRYQVLNPSLISQFALSFPCIVKPGNEDASHGLGKDSVVYDKDALRRQVERISTLFGGQALVEEFIDGREFNATVLGNDRPVVLPVSEIVYFLPSNIARIITYEGKWEKDSVFFKGTKPVCPATLSPDEKSAIKRIVMAAFRAVGCRGYARIDMRQDAEGSIKVLEVNPNPDIAPDSGAARQAQAAGLSYDEFILKIVQLALEDTRS
ncbi:MAG TPA: hypothetical protein DCX22_04610 [Dehalococcoidia bacterium]|nr:hypothetical protein [Dehalococcoidia bacterium]